MFFIEQNLKKIQKNDFRIVIFWMYTIQKLNLHFEFIFIDTYDYLNDRESLKSCKLTNIFDTMCHKRYISYIFTMNME